MLLEISALGCSYELNSMCANTPVPTGKDYPMLFIDASKAPRPVHDLALEILNQYSFTIEYQSMYGEKFILARGPTRLAAVTPQLTVRIRERQGPSLTTDQIVRTWRDLQQCCHGERREDLPGPT